MSLRFTLFTSIRFDFFLFGEITLWTYCCWRLSRCRFTQFVFVWIVLFLYCLQLLEEVAVCSPLADIIFRCCCSFCWSEHIIYLYTCSITRSLSQFSLFLTIGCRLHVQTPFLSWISRVDHIFFQHNFFDDQCILRNGKKTQNF